MQAEDIKMINTDENEFDPVEHSLMLDKINRERLEAEDEANRIRAERVRAEIEASQKVIDQVQVMARKRDVLQKKLDAIINTVENQMTQHHIDTLKRMAD